MFELKNLEFAYNSTNSFRFPNMKCQEGEHWLVTGPSGCGKTTFLHLMAGLLRPVHGQVIIDGTDITNMPFYSMDKLRGKKIGIVFQQHHFISSLTAIENVKLASYFNKQKIAETEMMNILNQLAIGLKYNSMPHELSQGEQQRLSIARAVINSPSVILADEPTSSLDDGHCHDVLILLTELAKRQNASLIVVTHDQRVKEYFSNIIHLDQARI